MSRTKNRKKRRLGAINKYAVKKDPFAKRYYYWHDWVVARMDIWSGYDAYTWKVERFVDKIIDWKDDDGDYWIDKEGYLHSRLFENNDIRSFDEYASIYYYAVSQLTDNRTRRRDRHKITWFKKRRNEWLADIEQRLQGKPVIRYGELRAKGLDKHPELLDPVKDKDIIEYLEYRKTISIDESPTKTGVKE